MAAKTTLEVVIAGDYSKLTRATKGARKNLTEFEKRTQAMSRTVTKAFAGIGAAFAIQRIARFSMEAAKAAGEDRRSQALLAETLKRSGKAKQADIDATEAMISRMEMATGKADDELRPAMAKLVSVTKDTKKAQDLLKLALGASAKSGKPVEATAIAIAKAYAGQTTSLIRMFPELKNSTDMFGDLAAATKGLAAQQADPFEKLNRFVDNLKEKIGSPILDRLTAFADDFTQADFDKVNTAIDGIATGIETFFKAIGDGDAKLGVIRTVETLAFSIRTSFEAAAAAFNILNGKKVDVSGSPGLTQFYDNLYNKDPKTGQYTTFKQSPTINPWMQSPYLKPGGSTGPNITYNVNVTGTKNMTGAEIVKSIRDYERTTGVRYVGGR